VCADRTAQLGCVRGLDFLVTVEEADANMEVFLGHVYVRSRFPAPHWQVPQDQVYHGFYLSAGRQRIKTSTVPHPKVDAEGRKRKEARPETAFGATRVSASGFP
jgi:hypothetical protein